MASWNQLYEKHFNGDQQLLDYFTQESGFITDSVLQPARTLFRIFSSGTVKGDVLIVYGGSNNLVPLLPACEYFKEIIIIDFLETNLQSLKKWLDKDPEAFNWTPVIKEICEMEGGGDKEETLRRIIKTFINSELTETYPLAPQMTIQSDCLISSHCLDLLSADRECFCKALKSMASLIKIGGFIVLTLVLGCTFGIVGKFKFPILYLKETFVKQAVVDTGFSIKELNVLPRFYETSYSIIDNSGILLLVACKEKVVQ